VFIALVFAVALKLCLRTHCWSWITHLVYWLSLAILFPFVYVISILWPQTYREWRGGHERRGWLPVQQVRDLFCGAMSLKQRCSDD